jgi:hypothetical protein
MYTAWVWALLARLNAIPVLVSCLPEWRKIHACNSCLPMYLACLWVLLSHLYFMSACVYCLLDCMYCTCVPVLSIPIARLMYDMSACVILSAFVYCLTACMSYVFLPVLSYTPQLHVSLVWQQEYVLTAWNYWKSHNREGEGDYVAGEYCWWGGIGSLWHAMHTKLSCKQGIFSMIPCPTHCLQYTLYTVYGAVKNWSLCSKLNASFCIQYSTVLYTKPCAP